MALTQPPQSRSKRGEASGVVASRQMRACEHRTDDTDAGHAGRRQVSHKQDDNATMACI